MGSKTARQKSRDPNTWLQVMSRKQVMYIRVVRVLRTGWWTGDVPVNTLMYKEMDRQRAAHGKHQRKEKAMQRSIKLAPL